MRSEIYAAAEALGFGPVTEGSAHRRIGPEEYTRVRRREGWVEEPIFRPSTAGGEVDVRIEFSA